MTPVQVGTANDWQSISFDQDHSLAIKKDGTLWAWIGYSLELNAGQETLVPLQVGTGTNWESISTGIDYYATIQTDSTLWTWGLNTSGQLGDCALTNEALPIKINCVANCDPLPVSLTSFSAKRQGNEALLNWQTLEEQNNKEYVIERSTNNTFYQIGIVRSYNNLNGSRYNFTDKRPGSGYNYYRLRIVDADGNYRYSKTFALKFDQVQAGISIYPNPIAIDVVSVENNLPGKILSISIHDLEGRRVYQATKPNNPRIGISISILSTGSYVLTVSDGKNKASKKIFKE